MSEELIDELARVIEHGLAYDVETNVYAGETCIEERRCIAARMMPTIRDYGDQRYQQAIADVVEWLRDRAKADRANSSDCRSGNAGKTLIRFARRREDDAAEITQRFGKDA